MSENLLRGKKLLLLLIVLYSVIGFALYSDVLMKGVFIFDDFEYVVDNPIIQNLSIFEDMTDPRHIGYLSFAMNYMIGGQDPFGYHLVNVLIHIANAILVFFLIRVILGVLSSTISIAKKKTVNTVVPGPVRSVHDGITAAAPFYDDIDPDEADLPSSGAIMTYAASIGEPAGSATEAPAVPAPDNAAEPEPVAVSSAVPVLQSTRGFDRNNALAFIAGLIFLVHPIETQAVSYVTQRFTSLSAFFYLLAVFSYFVARVRLEAGKRGFSAYWPYFLSLASTVLAMKTKEIAFTIPFIIAIFEFLMFKRSIFKSRRFYYLIPFAATLALIPLALFGPEWGILGTGSGVDEITRRDKLYDLYQRAPDEYLFTQFRVVTTYIRLFFLPMNQLTTYDYRASHTFFEPSVVLSLLLLLSIAGAGLYAWKQAGEAAGEEEQGDAPLLKLAALGIIWFFMTLSIESSFIPIKDMIFEHRMYLPSVGFFSAASVVIYLVADRAIKYGGKYAGGPLKAAWLAAVIAVLFSAATFSRNDIWTSEIKFWDDVVKKTGKAIGYNNRGNAYLHAGQLQLALQDLNTTISFFPEAVKDKMAWKNADFTPTNMSKTYTSRANLYAQLGDYDHAKADFEMARRVLLMY